MAPKLKRPASSMPRGRSMRRPARGREVDDKEKEALKVEEYHQLASLTMESLKRLDIIELGEASHYGGHVKVAGRVVSLRPSEEEMDFELTGTLTDRLARRKRKRRKSLIRASRVRRLHQAPRTRRGRRRTDRSSKKPGGCENSVKGAQGHSRPRLWTTSGSTFCPLEVNSTVCLEIS